MLIIARREGERIVVAAGTEIVVAQISGDAVRLGLRATNGNWGRHSGIWEVAQPGHRVAAFEDWDGSRETQTALERVAIGVPSLALSRSLLRKVVGAP